MKNTHKIITSLAALGALCVGSVAIAQPWHHGGPDGGRMGPGAECPMGGPGPQPGFDGRNAQEVRSARWAALASMLTLKPEQEGAWKAYVEARDALKTPFGEQQKYAADEQTRLENRAERAKIRADQLARVAAARAELLKVLSPEQKYVLEGMEFHHGRRGFADGPRGPRGPHHEADGWHGPRGWHGPMGGDCFNRECPWQQR